jgi:hydrogenase small subunit
MRLASLSTSNLTVHLFWLAADVGGSRDSLSAATLPIVEDLVARTVPGLPKVVCHSPLGDDRRDAGVIQCFWKAAAGELDPFILIVEGSIPADDLKSANEWPTGDAAARVTSRLLDQQATTTEWLDRLGPVATAIVAAGTCATYGGVTPVTENRGGVMGVPDYLGWNWRSKVGLPVVCVPGCPVAADNLTETLLYLLYYVTGQATVMPLDENLRPAWLFCRRNDDARGRAGSDQLAPIAHEHRSSECLAKTGRVGFVPEAMMVGALPDATSELATRIATNRTLRRRAS